MKVNERKEKERKEGGERKEEEMKANSHRADFSDKCFFQYWQ